MRRDCETKASAEGTIEDIALKIACIALLFIILQEEQEKCSNVCRMNETMTNMLVFPNYVSKKEYLMWVREYDMTEMEMFMTGNERSTALFIFRKF